jgi:hypothetical protein
MVADQDGLEPYVNDEAETEEHPPPAPLAPAPTSVGEDRTAEDEVQDALDELMKKALPDAEFREQLRKATMKMRKKIGLVALDSADQWDSDILIEKALHYVRFQPQHLFDCPIEELHALEMVMSSAIAYVQNLQNEYGIRYDSAKVDYDRAINATAQHCPGKTQKERVAYALTNIKELKRLDRHVQMLKVYRDMLNGIPDAYEKIDMSMKKVIARRDYKIIEKGGNKW